MFSSSFNCSWFSMVYGNMTQKWMTTRVKHVTMVAWLECVVVEHVNPNDYTTGGTSDDGTSNAIGLSNSDNVDAEEGG